MYKRKRWLAGFLAVMMLWSGMMISDSDRKVFAAHAHTDACYDGVKHVHSGSSGGGGGCYGKQNSSSYTCSANGGRGCVAYDRWFNRCNSCGLACGHASSCPTCGGSVSSSGIIHDYHCPGHTVISYSLNCGKTAGVYYQNGASVAASCDQVVTAVQMLHPVQDVNYMESGDYTAILTFLDGHTETLQGVSGYDPMAPASFGVENAYKVIFSQYDRVGTAAQRSVPETEVRIRTLGLRGVEVKQKYQVVYQGQSIDTSFVAHWEGGMTTEEAAGTAMSDYNSQQVGEQKVTVSWTLDETHADDIYVLVLPVPTSIALESNMQAIYEDESLQWNAVLTMSDGQSHMVSLDGTEREERLECSYVYQDGTEIVYDICRNYVLREELESTSTAGVGDRYEVRKGIVLCQEAGTGREIQGEAIYRVYPRMSEMMVDESIQFLYQGQEPKMEFQIRWSDGVITKYPDGAESDYSRKIGTEEVMVTYLLSRPGRVDDVICDPIWVRTLSRPVALQVTGPTDIPKGEIPEWTAEVQYQDGSRRVVTATAVEVVDIQSEELQGEQRIYQNVLAQTYQNGQAEAGSVIDSECGYQTGGVYEVHFYWKQDGLDMEPLEDVVILSVWDSCGTGLGHAEYTAVSCPVCDLIRERRVELEEIKQKTLDLMLQDRMEIQGQVETLQQQVQDTLKTDILERYQQELTEEEKALQEVEQYLKDLEAYGEQIQKQYQEACEALENAVVSDEVETICASMSGQLQEGMSIYQQKLQEVEQIQKQVGVYQSQSEEIRATRPVLELPEQMNLVYEKEKMEPDLKISSPLIYDQQHEISYQVLYTERYTSVEKLEQEREKALEKLGVQKDSLKPGQVLGLWEMGYLREQPEYLKPGVYEVYVYTTDPDYQNVVDTLVCRIEPRIVVPLIHAEDKVYDGTTAAAIRYGELLGVLPGDEVNFRFDGTAAFVSEEVATEAAIVFSGEFLLEGAEADCYQWGEIPVVTADICKIPIYARAVDVAKQYGRQNPALTALYLIDGIEQSLEDLETLGVVPPTAYVESFDGYEPYAVGEYPIHITGGSDGAHHEWKYETGKLTVTVPDGSMTVQLKLPAVSFGGVVADVKIVDQNGREEQLRLPVKEDGSLTVYLTYGEYQITVSHEQDEMMLQQTLCKPIPVLPALPAPEPLNLEQSEPKQVEGEQSDRVQADLVQFESVQFESVQPEAVLSESEQTKSTELVSESNESDTLQAESESDVLGFVSEQSEILPAIQQEEQEESKMALLPEAEKQDIETLSESLGKAEEKKAEEISEEMPAEMSVEMQQQVRQQERAKDAWMWIMPVCGTVLGCAMYLGNRIFHRRKRYE